MSLSDLFSPSPLSQISLSGLCRPKHFGLNYLKCLKNSYTSFFGCKSHRSACENLEKEAGGDEIFSSTQGLQLFFKCRNVKKHMQSEIRILRQSHSYSNIIELCQLFRVKSPHRLFTHLCLITLREFGYNYLVVICFVFSSSFHPRAMQLNVKNKIYYSGRY